MHDAWLAPAFQVDHWIFIEESFLLHRNALRVGNGNSTQRMERGRLILSQKEHSFRIPALILYLSLPRRYRSSFPLSFSRTVPLLNRMLIVVPNAYNKLFPFSLRRLLLVNYLMRLRKPRREKAATSNSRIKLLCSDNRNFEPT